MAQKDVIENRGKRPVNIGLPWSLLLIPVLFLAAGISIPYSAAARQVRRRRESALLAKMRARNRTIGWRDFIDAISEHRGTAIEERSSLKSSDRWWWTPDNLYLESPYPIADWQTMREDSSFDQFSIWCHNRYTGPETGDAFLVRSREAPRGEVFEFWSRLRSGDDVWVEVVPVDALPRNRRPESQVSS
jgi:hypothetical protein